jgi:predicted RNase H-like nuclease (RuvC/YqgF family)
MADELDVQIKAVETEIAEVKAEIAEVKVEIKEVTEQLKPIVEQLGDPKLSETKLAILAERERRLGAEVQRLGTKEHDLREKEKLLMAKQQQGAGCRSWPATILCARTLVACLLSCHAP